MISLPKPLELDLNRRAKGEGYQISGGIVLGLGYEGQKLSVRVFKAQGLAAVSKKSSNPYVKLYLLPDRHTKRKTKIKKKALDPVYNQTITVCHFQILTYIQCIVCITVTRLLIMSQRPAWLHNAIAYRIKTLF